jgi:hypothetical protein
MHGYIPPISRGELGAYLHLGVAAFSVIGITVMSTGNSVQPSRWHAPREPVPLESFEPGGPSLTHYVSVSGVLLHS